MGWREDFSNQQRDAQQDETAPEVLAFRAMLRRQTQEAMVRFEAERMDQLANHQGTWSLQ